MTPIESFKFLFERAYWWLSRQPISRIHNGEIVGRPGELVERMSAEERQALKGLTSDQIAEGKVSTTDIAVAADSTFLSGKDYLARTIREAKLKFDKTIIKTDPKADRKKY